MVVSVDDIKMHLRIEEDDDTENVYLESLLMKVQAMAEDYCRVKFEKEVTEDE